MFHEYTVLLFSCNYFLYTSYFKLYRCFSCRYCRAGPSESIENHTDDPRIFNFVSSPENPLTWRIFSTTLMYYILHRPTAKAMWYPTLIMNSSVFLHKLTVLILHYLPAFLLDLVFICTGNKLRFVGVWFYFSVNAVSIAS